MMFYDKSIFVILNYATLYDLKSKFRLTLVMLTDRNNIGYFVCLLK